VQLQNLQAYRKSVLSAFADVDKALIALSQTIRQERLQVEAVRNSQRSFDLVKIQLESGTVNQVTLLQTQQTLLTNENTLVQVRLTKLMAASSLFQALGGGWKPENVQASQQPQATDVPPQ
jgi:outer membrane protein, multidrug efflux system